MKELIQHLRYLENGGSPASVAVGLCREINLEFGEAHTDVLRDLWPNWPEYSGNFAHPVVDGHYPPAYAYYAYSDLWDITTEYGRTRRRLCGWLADTLEEGVAHG